MPKHLNSADDFEMVPIGRLKVHPRNVNESDLGAIIESIKAQGFYGALVAQRGTNFVCAGNHRLLAAQELGFDTLPVTWIDCDDETALRVMIADNATTRRGHDNPAALAELLAELAATETGLGAGLGYDGDDLDQLLSDLSHDVDWAESAGALPDGEKAPFQQVTFTLHDSQADTVNAALDQAKKRGNFDGSPNENSNGNALAFICNAFING